MHHICVDYSHELREKREKGKREKYRGERGVILSLSRSLSLSLSLSLSFSCNDHNAANCGAVTLMQQFFQVTVTIRKIRERDGGEDISLSLVNVLHYILFFYF